MVFDFDPHDSRFDEGILRRMLEYFDDSAGNGKLFINYPMLESYRHLDEPWDEGYFERTVSISDVTRYKEIVNRECCSQMKQLNKYNRETFDMLIKMNLKKAGIVAYGVEPRSSEDYLAWNNTDVYDEQVRMLKEEGRFFVLNTRLFSVVDYNPRMFFGIQSSDEDIIC